MASTSNNPTVQEQANTCLDSELELWYAIAGEHVRIPEKNSKVYYFAKGHSESASGTQTDGHIQSEVLCIVEAVKYYVKWINDRLFTEIRLRPLFDYCPTENADYVVKENPTCSVKKAYLVKAKMGGCKIHLTRECGTTLFFGVFSDAYVQFKDVHGRIYSIELTYPPDTDGVPVLGTGWDDFVSGKSLKAGDIVIFMKDRNGDLRVGIRRRVGNISVNEEKPLSFLNTIGHLALKGQPFFVYYYPDVDASPEFVVDAARVDAAVSIPWSDGSMFTMPYVNESTLEASTSVGIVSSIEPPFSKSKWRSLKVRVPQLSAGYLRVSPWTVISSAETKPSSLDSHRELWYACAGTSIQIPEVNSLAYYFVQGHLKHATRLKNDELYENFRQIPASILCKVEAVSFLAEQHTDEVFAKIKLRPVGPSKPPVNVDSEANPAAPQTYTVCEVRESVHGYLKPECRQMLFAGVESDQSVRFTDVRGAHWDFVVTYPRGAKAGPVLTTGWDRFVSSKGLIPGDFVILMRDRNGDLRVGIQRGGIRKVDFGEKQVYEAGILAVENQTFEVLYYPRAATPEFVISRKHVEDAESVSWTEGTRIMISYDVYTKTELCEGTVITSSLPADVRWPLSPWGSLQVSLLSSELQLRISPWLAMKF